MKSKHKPYNLIILVLLFSGLLSIVITPAKANPTNGSTGPDQPNETPLIFLPFINQGPNNPTINPPPTATPLPKPQNSAIYYISPNGDDRNSGTSEAKPWATFNHAWENIYPGDTLILLDGTYYQSINPNKRNGEPGNPITIRSKNDGKAIIDGENKRVPVQLGNTWPGPIGNYFVIEGIVAKNSNDFVISLDSAQHNILRRVSAYNANNNSNSAVIGIIWPASQYNLIEDCVVSGTGRKMVYIYQGEHNTIRRCFAAWKQWDGRDFCSQEWPNGTNLQIYNGSNNIIENSIAYGGVPKWNVSMGVNGEKGKAVGNQILGTISILAGKNWDGSLIDYGQRPPTSCGDAPVAKINEWKFYRIGFMFDNIAGATASGNIFRDIFSWGNAGEGIGYDGPSGAANIDHATIVHSDGLGYNDYGWNNPNINEYSLTAFSSISNSFIEKTSYLNGGARLNYRYIDGVLTNQPLWPWPMEDRIKSELGISVTQYMTSLLTQNNVLNRADPFAQP